MFFPGTQSLQQSAATFLACLLSCARGGPVDLPHQVVENFVDVELRLCRRFQEGAVAKHLCEGLTLILSYHTLVFEITLVPNQDQRHLMTSLHESITREHRQRSGSILSRMHTGSLHRQIRVCILLAHSRHSRLGWDKGASWFHGIPRLHP